MFNAAIHVCTVDGDPVNSDARDSLTPLLSNKSNRSPAGGSSYNQGYCNSTNIIDYIYMPGNCA